MTDESDRLKTARKIVLQHVNSDLKIVKTTSMDTGSAGKILDIYPMSTLVIVWVIAQRQRVRRVRLGRVMISLQQAAINKKNVWETLTNVTNGHSPNCL